MLYYHVCRHIGARILFGWVYFSLCLIQSQLFLYYNVAICSNSSVRFGQIKPFILIHSHIFFADRVCACILHFLFIINCFFFVILHLFLFFSALVFVFAVCFFLILRTFVCWHTHMHTFTYKYALARTHTNAIYNAHNHTLADAKFMIE